MSVKDLAARVVPKMDKTEKLDEVLAANLLQFHFCYVMNIALATNV